MLRKPLNFEGIDNVLSYQLSGLNQSKKNSLEPFAIMNKFSLNDTTSKVICEIGAKCSLTIRFFVGFYFF